MNITEGYKTKQRDLILDYFIKNQENHFTAEEIIEHLKQKGTAVGKSTVYRYLDKLVKDGTVRKYFIEEGISACYQYAQSSDKCMHHFHLKCLNCGKLFHIECNYLNEADEHILSHHNFKVDNTKTVLYGKCEECSRLI